MGTRGPHTEASLVSLAGQAGGPRHDFRQNYCHTAQKSLLYTYHMLFVSTIPRAVGLTGFELNWELGKAMAAAGLPGCLALRSPKNGLPHEIPFCGDRTSLKRTWGMPYLKAGWGKGCGVR